MSSISRRFLKSLVPPLFPAAVRRLFPKKPVWFWDGIYQHMHDVPSRNASYDNGERIQEMASHATNLLEQVRSGQKPRNLHYVLATVSATVSAGSGRVTVVDFGGGIGTGFIQLLDTLPAETKIEYHVIDLEGICVAGAKVFASDPRIHFHTSLGAVGATPDIVYVNSVLQYIEDYAAQLRQLAALKAPWLLLARLASGAFPTFATRQLNLTGQVVPHWFLNRSEVVTILSGSGYSKVFEGLDDLEYDMGNFPETHRSGRMCNLLFTTMSNNGLNG